MCKGKYIQRARKKERKRDGWMCDPSVLKSLRDEVINAHERKRLILFCPIYHYELCFL